MLKNLLKKILICGIISMICLSTQSFAQRRSSSPALQDITYRIEPIFGYETVYRSTPKSHTVTRMFYGARVTAGIDIVSAELEYTQGNDTKDYDIAPEKIKTTDEKAKLGIRSTFRLTDLFNMSTRLGCQAKKTTQEVTNLGVTTTEEKPIEYSPYAGAAFGIQLGKAVRISIGTTVVFKDINDMEQNEYQNAVAVGFGI